VPEAPATPDRPLPAALPAPRRRGGFTLLELVIAVAILSILVVMAVPVMRLEFQRQKEAELRQDLRTLREAIDAYKRATDDGRIAKKAEGSGYPPRLEDLLNGVPDMKSLKGRTVYILRRIPRDPFNADSTLAPADTWGKRAYSSPPDAPLEGEDVFDVYSRAEGNGINGIAYHDW
jgi:general secretion pathway protein G